MNINSDCVKQSDRCSGLNTKCVKKPIKVGTAIKSVLNSKTGTQMDVILVFRIFTIVFRSL